MKEILVSTKDKYQIAGLHYEAPNPESVLIINSATATPQDFYKKFASFMAENGIATIIHGILPSQKI